MSYFFDQAAEDRDYELNARYDYVSEAFGEEARLLDRMARFEAEEDAREWQAEVEALGPYLFEEFGGGRVTEVVRGVMVTRDLALVPAGWVGDRPLNDDIPF